MPSLLIKIRFAPVHAGIHACLLGAVLLITVLGSSTRTAAQTFSVIHNFGNGADGYAPYAGVTIDRAGNLEGTTFFGGSPANAGAIYKVVHLGSGWTVGALYEFAGGNDGAHPQARVIIGPDGNLYGTTLAGGGMNNCGGEYTGCGIVFELSPPTSVCRSVSCPWNETVLYRFPGGAAGAQPGSGELLFDTHGNIYGTTQYGGSQNGGTVYQLSRSTGAWVHTVIYNFNVVLDGGYPMAGVITDAAGNLYGTTPQGGSGNAGTVYELSPSGSGWTEKTLHVMNDSTDGAYIQGGLILDRAGNLYGAAAAGGPYGSGTVFELMPAGDSWDLSVLYDNFGEGDGYEGPTSSLAIDGSGTLYGTSVGWVDGDNFGTIFKLTPSGGGWAYALLHQFMVTDGYYPFAGVTLDTSRKLYGTASEGGTLGGGTLWTVTQ